MKNLKKSLVPFCSPSSPCFSLFHFSFVAKTQIHQKNQLNSQPLHPRHLPHYHPNPPPLFNPLSRQAPPITETITPSPHHHLRRPRAHPFYLQPPRIVGLPSIERLRHLRSSSSVQTTLTSHHEIALAMALPSACLSGSNLEGLLLHLARAP